MKRKLFCIWMCIALIVTLIPSMTFAEEPSEAPAVQVGNKEEPISETSLFAEADEQQGEAEAFLAKYDEDADNYYFSATETVYASAGRDGSYYYLGTKSGDHFTEVNSEQLESCTMTVKKNGVVQGKTVVSTADGITQKDLITGIDYGISCKQDKATNEVLQIYPELSFYLSSEATKDYQAVCGTYTIEATWTENGKNYTAATEMIVIPGKVLSEILSMSKDKNGVIDSMYANDTEASQGLTVQYSPFKSYMETQWNEETDAEEQVEITESYIYTDSDVSGIFDFIGVEGSSDDVASAAAGVFATGEKLLFDSQTQVVPLVVHRKNISSDMIGKTFSLQFRNGERIATVTAKIENEDANISLEENKLYAFRTSGGVVSEIDAAGNIKLNSNANLQQDVQTHIEISADEGGSYVFAVYQEGKLQAVKLKIENENKPMQVEAVGDYEYVLEGLQPGECVLHAADDASLSILCRVGLPERGIYASRERSENAYLDSEFHFINAKQKKSDNSEAYFYVMMPKYNSDIIKTQNDLTISFARYNNDKDAWVLRNEDGIYFTQDGIYTDADNGKDYYVWKVTVQEKYEDDQRTKCIRVYGGLRQDEESGETYYGYSRNIWLHIYDSQEIDEEHQLYWFYASSEIEISTDGKIALSSETEEVLDGRANIQIYRENKSGSIDGYFAVKKDGEYYALRTVQTSKTEGISLSASADTQYLYKLEWSKFGEYHITATENETEYRLNFNAKLPEIGFYSTSSRNEEAYLDEFYYTTASDKNADRTESYFYLIAPTYGYATEQMELSFGKWTWNEETNDELWSETIITGLSAGSPEIKEFGNEEYAVWKITVSDAYQNPYANRQELRIAYGKEGMSRTKSIIIYDSTEISEEEQLYWVSVYLEIEIDGSGKISLSGDSTGSLDNRTATEISWKNKSGSMEGYFAVKKNGEYYALRTVQTSETEGISVTEYADTPYLYKVEWSEFGKYHIIATDNEAEYRLNFNVELPEIGFYSTSNRSEENYLDEFYYADAVEKSEDGKEAYFYLIAPTNRYALSQIQSCFVNYSEKEVSVPGLSIGAPEIKSFEEKEYVIWKIIVSEDYDHSEGLSHLFKVTYGKDNDEGTSQNYDLTQIRIYDSSAIPSSQQLYFFYSGDVTVNEDGRLEARETEDNLNDLAFRLLSGGNSLTYGYFAVKQGDAYYAVTTLSAPDNVTITKIKDKLYTYYIKIGEYEVTATYQGKQYRMEAVHQLPGIGFFATAERTAENYLYGEFWVKEAVEEDKDKAETYFYLYWKCYSEEQVDDTVRIESSARANDDRGGVKIEQLEQTVEEEETYRVYKITVPSSYIANTEKSGIKNCEEWRITIGENMFTTVRIYDAEAIRSEAQLYWIYENFAQRKNGRLEPLEGHDSVYGRTEIERLTYDAYSPLKGYFAVLKDGEYYPVNNISTTEEISASFDESTGIFTLTALHVGAYTISYSDGKNNYYFKGRVEFPRAGCFVSTTRTEDTYIKNEEMFDHNTANENKSFYLIASENFIRVNNSSDPSRVHMKLKELEGRDISGIELGNSGTFEENGETYYYWEINVTKSFQHSSDYVQCVVELKDGDRSLYGRFLKIRGYVKYGDIDKNDKTDFADALWLKRYLASWDNYRYIGRREADVDRDGKITASDLMILERHVASWKGYEKLPKVSLRS